MLLQTPVIEPGRYANLNHLTCKSSFLLIMCMFIQLYFIQKTVVCRFICSGPTVHPLDCHRPCFQLFNFFFFHSSDACDRLYTQGCEQWLTLRILVDRCHKIGDRTLKPELVLASLCCTVDIENVSWVSLETCNQTPALLLLNKQEDACISSLLRLAFDTPPFRREAARKCQRFTLSVTVSVSYSSPSVGGKQRFLDTIPGTAFTSLSLSLVAGLGCFMHEGVKTK